ncbi:MAG: glycoside hydrolase family 3 C-terminal domain-containing protein [Candidatus Sumerlaeia bacterium]|nr:glycoside hydrolase family 3 C-terminal domain-containing protein [Candidatus Sumerlaeia bacterium]
MGDNSSRDIRLMKGNEALAEAAIQAGCDFILMPPDPLEARQVIVKAVKQGEISISQLDTVVSNILALKTRLGLHKCRMVQISRVDKVVGNAEHLKKALNIARKTITLVFNKNHILPISPETRTAVIGMVNQRGQLTIWRDKYDFGSHLKRFSSKVSYLFMGDTITETDSQKAIARVKAADILVLALYPRILIGKGFIKLHPQQLDFIKHLMRFKKPTVVISFGSPYILDELPPVNAYLCAYGNADVVHQATAEVLFGITNPTARLPVTINKQFKFGSGEGF